MVALAVVLGVFILEGLQRVLAEVSYDDILGAAADTPISSLLLALLATAASYVTLAGYDFSSLRYAGARLPRPTVFLTSFIAYALGNSVGLGVLTGGGVRMRLFAAAGLEPSAIAKAAVFNALAFGLGMVAFGALGVLWGAAEVAPLLRVPESLLQVLAFACLGAVAAFIAVCGWRRHLVLGKWRMPLPTAGLALRQLLISGVELAAAAAALWFLLPSGTVGLPEFAAFYVMAIALGVISHVPGGLGVFEAVILLGLAGTAPAGEIAAALALYRCLYFLLPLALATVLLAVLEARASRAAAPIARAARRLAPRLVSALTLVTGITLLISGITPTSETAVESLAGHLPLAMVEASHLVGSVAGFVLLLLARGLVHRLKAAWWGTVFAMGLATLVALPKGMALPELALLVGFFALLLLTRRQFDRPSSLLSQTFEAGWLIAVACVLGGCAWLLFFVYRDVEYSRQLWWEFAFDGHAPRALRALMAVSLLALGAGLWQLMRRPSGKVVRPDAAALDAAHAVVRTQPVADAALALMGDKSLLFSPSGKAFLMFAKQGRSWIALSDPVGLRSEWQELVWRFIEMADAHGGRAVFYKTRPHTLPLYLDAGLRAWKLGEEAYVPLPEFSLQGPRRAKLRQSLSRGERDGLVFEILPSEAVPQALPELKRVSDAWLAMHRAQEKGFSLGGFDRTYLQRQPVAVVRHVQPDGSQPIVAFASLMGPQSERIEMAVDLMRHVPEAPAVTMEYLFVRLLTHFQAEGYQRFNLGMAPMSGMAEHELASAWHRAARLLFNHGGRFYNFRGLRAFKEKFDPTWEARYMICPRGLAPIFALADTTTLIGGGLKGVVAK
ncbi:bifunctional lysylphosphatidylglycerol flippase/synthetase MprF [Verticiella alkaliphila]|uniref:bifunctional lysylphosphatidylglycerol flippase/synthetase MprF n=1 Tax=Verticiella alkaliphila TaxID=2779529 RepID=UPI00209AF4EF|nr:bifunctional lysylphosphatidylglycerol flippase/synthetase MprF [Verticiella sp. GG226]